MLTMAEIGQINKAVTIIEIQGFKLISIRQQKNSLTKFDAYAEYGDSEEIYVLFIDTVKEIYEVIC